MTLENAFDLVGEGTEGWKMDPNHASFEHVSKKVSIVRRHGLGLKATEDIEPAEIIGIFTGGWMYADISDERAAIDKEWQFQVKNYAVEQTLSLVSFKNTVDVIRNIICVPRVQVESKDGSFNAKMLYTHLGSLVDVMSLAKKQSDDQVVNAEAFSSSVFCAHEDGREHTRLCIHIEAKTKIKKGEHIVWDYKWSSENDVETHPPPEFVDDTHVGTVYPNKFDNTISNKYLHPKKGEGSISNRLLEFYQQNTGSKKKLPARFFGPSILQNKSKRSSFSHDNENGTYTPYTRGEELDSPLYYYTPGLQDNQALRSYDGLSQ